MKTMDKFYNFLTRKLFRNLYKILGKIRVFLSCVFASILGCSMLIIIMVSITYIGLTTERDWGGG